MSSSSLMDILTSPWTFQPKERDSSEGIPIGLKGLQVTHSSKLEGLNVK